MFEIVAVDLEQRDAGHAFAAEEAGAPRLEAPGPPSTSVASPSASASLSLYYSRGEHPTSATWSACLVTVMGGTSLGMGEHPHESPWPSPLHAVSKRSRRLLGDHPGGTSLGMGEHPHETQVVTRDRYLNKMPSVNQMYNKVNRYTLI